MGRISTFKDVSSDGFVAASGIYRFDKKHRMPKRYTSRQSELFKSGNQYMRRLTQECFYYKSTLSEKAFNNYVARQKRIVERK